MGIYSQFQATDARLIRVKRLAVQLNHLKSLPHRSPLRFLGYFAILEGLLTHAPKHSDPCDSITHQLKRKIALLDNRWEHRVDYGPFGGAKPETIWTEMYSYRSRLAHGGSPEIGKDFSVLGSDGKALALLIETVKAVFRQALLEPQLLTDLRIC
jgi:Apea-like HEPN